MNGCKLYSFQPQNSDVLDINTVSDRNLTTSLYYNIIDTSNIVWLWNYTPSQLYSYHLYMFNHYVLIDDRNVDMLIAIHNITLLWLERVIINH